MARKFRIRIRTDLCKECGLCVSVCPQKWIRMSSEANEKGFRVAEVDADQRCIGCGQCADMCPEGAIEVEAVTDEPEKDAAEGGNSPREAGA